MSLLKLDDRSRIVLVPGNHDVSWDPKINEEIFKPVASNSALRKSRESWIEKIEKTDLRRCEEQDRIRWFKLNHKKYRHRLQNVARFFDTFYRPPGKKEALTGESRPFNFEADHEDWSAHVFPDEERHGFAFFGFNSCYRNDRY
jgi:hypothetical protein